MTDAGSYLIVFHEDGTAFQAREADRDTILLAWTHWLERGQDVLLSFRALSGEECMIRASTIDTITTSSPQGRFAAAQFQAALEAERKEHLRQLGIFDSDEEW